MSGKLAEAILGELDSGEINGLLGDSVPVAERVPSLRDLLARQLELKRKDVFESLYNGADEADDQVRIVRQHFPRLDKPLARRLIARLPQAERNGWGSLLEMPEQLRTLAAEMNGDSVMVRVYEGLYFPSIAEADSDRLILACLSRLEGWSPQMGLELRGGSSVGPILGRAGKVGAPVKRIIVKNNAGYRAYEGSMTLQSLAPAAQDNTLFKALLHALPDAQRDALNVQLHDHDRLRSLVLEVAKKHRGQAERWLYGVDDLPQWPYTGRLAGGGSNLGRMLSYLPAAVNEPYAHRQYRSLFPGASDAVRERDFALWREAGTVPIDEINNLTEEWRRLETRLAGWAGTEWKRARISEQIRKAWQQVTQFDSQQGVPMLDLADRNLTDQDFADFPLLDASFDHVLCLELSGNDLTQLPDRLLRSFRRVQWLYASGNDLTRLPFYVEGAPLKLLDLRGNRIELDPAGQNWLASCVQLDTLALAGNPLGVAPDLTALSLLRIVKLAECDLTQLPDGLARLSRLERAELFRNAIVELPANLSELPVNIGRALDLGENPLGEQAMEQVDAYYNARGIDLDEEAGKDPLNFADSVDPQSLQRWHGLRQSGSRALFRALANLSETVTFRVAEQTLRRRVDEVLIWLEGSQAARTEVYGLKKPAFIDIEQKMRVARVFSDVPPAQQSLRLLERVTGFIRLPYIDEWIRLLFEDYVQPPAYPYTREVIVQTIRGAASTEPRLWMPEAPRPDEDIDVDLADPAAFDVLDEHIEGVAVRLLTLDAGSPEGLEAIVGNDYWVRHLNTLSTRFAELDQEFTALEAQVMSEEINENHYNSEAKRIAAEHKALQESLTQQIYQQLQGQG
ncbi:hypothetical protein NVV94_10105 [Pseudomonas sp. LS1212]|uniref:leucine-rich repeat domain-containing protein n=1 Tax=Pseudomonas sp. LS1212 TaxID=2972478 RepID=UPI00215D4556|nr:hypothetical protein [Pseudomonas sp. LS1212]UVJ45859.1 hypothetical protein NVV94_10105 [Pseudomonas sp. LS1212]